MCHSFLIVYYWNDTEFLTLPDLPPDTIEITYNVLSILLPTFPITLLSVRLPHCLKVIYEVIINNHGRLVTNPVLQSGALQRDIRVNKSETKLHPLNALSSRFL